MNSSATSYTRAITQDQASRLRELLDERGWKFEPKEYTLFAASKEKTNVAVYLKGPKVLVQGKGTREFVEFLLEPEVLGTAEIGYDEVKNPQMYEPHFGIDESGKGDFFGPLVVAGVYTNRDIARQLIAAGIQDSKAIGSDARIRDLAETVRSTPGVAWEVLSWGPERYNGLYDKFKNLNRQLAWGHSKVIGTLLEKVPDCPRTLSDQFARADVLQRALGPLAKKIILEQRTKGESDVAVAAASILARERFIDWMDEASRRLGFKLPRGATSVKSEARRLITERGPEFLPKVCKMHFKTAREVLGLPPLKEDKPWRKESQL